MLVLVESLLRFLHRAVANVTGVTRAEHVLAVQVRAHVVLVAGQVEAEPTSELAFLRPLRVHVHSVCQRIQVKFMQIKDNLLDTWHVLHLVVLLTYELMLPEKLSGVDQHIAIGTLVGFGGQLV